MMLLAFKTLVKPVDLAQEVADYGRSLHHLGDEAMYVIRSLIWLAGILGFFAVLGLVAPANAKPLLPGPAFASVTCKDARSASEMLEWYRDSGGITDPSEYAKANCYLVRNSVTLDVMREGFGPLEVVECVTDWDMDRLVLFYSEKADPSFWFWYRVPDADALCAASDVPIVTEAGFDI